MSEPRTADDASRLDFGSPAIRKRYLRLLLLGILIGVPVSVLAVGFLGLVNELRDLLWIDLPKELGRDTPPWYLILGLPLIGAVIVYFARRLLPGDGGHEPLGGLSTAPTPLAYAPGVVLAALGTLPFGVVLGPEAPLIALGSACALGLTRFAKLNKPEQTVISLAGSMSAISALFGGPLVAGIFIIEAGIGMGAALIPVMIPGLLAAAVGYLIFTGVGDWGGLEETAISVPGLPAYEGTHIYDLLLAVAIAVAVAVVIVGVRRLGMLIAGPGQRRLGVAGLLFSGALAIGLVVLLAEALGADPVLVLFSGQAAVPTILAEASVGIILVAIVAKAIAYAVSLACGFRGGPVFPAIFLGVAVATLAVVWFDTSPTLALAVGASAGMAAATRLLLASLVLTALLVGSDGLDAMPAAIFATGTAWLVVTVLDRPSPASPASPSPPVPDEASTPVAGT